MKPRLPLSPRQREILRLALRGKADKEIAGALGISQATVKSHWAQIFLRLRAKSRVHAWVVFAQATIIQKGYCRTIRKNAIMKVNDKRCVAASPPRIPERCVEPRR